MTNKTNKKLGIALTAAGLVLVPAVACAQATLIRPAYSYPTTPTGSGPASVQVSDSPFFFTPYVGLAVGRDDNVFLSNTNEKTSTVYVVSPGFKFDSRDANKVVQLGYQGQIGRYAQSEDDDYIDHTARAQFDMAITARNFLRLGYDYVRSHDPRGSTDRAIAGSPDKYRLHNTSATYAFGAPGAEGRVELYANEASKVYLNNRAATAASDRLNHEFGGAVYWRVAPKTYLLFEARNTNVSYRQSGSASSSEERRYYGGVSWDATASTTGTLKVGRLKKRFDSDVPMFSGTGWEASVTWAPRTYSRFDFYTARQPNESSGLGSFILSEVSGVSWSHSWSSVLTTGVDLRYQKDEYQNFNRTDDIKSLGVKVGYRFRRWLTLGAEITHTQRDSDRGQSEYDRNLYLLTATASM